MTEQLYSSWVIRQSHNEVLILILSFSIPLHPQNWQVPQIGCDTHAFTLPPMYSVSPAVFLQRYLGSGSEQEFSNS